MAEINWSKKKSEVITKGHTYLNKPEGIKLLVCLNMCDIKNGIKWLSLNYNLVKKSN